MAMIANGVAAGIVNACRASSPRRIDEIWRLDGGLARFGKSHIKEPDALAEGLAKGAAIAEADTSLVAVPNQLGVDYYSWSCRDHVRRDLVGAKETGGVGYNAKLPESIARPVAPAVGWC